MEEMVASDRGTEVLRRGPIPRKYGIRYKFGSWAEAQLEAGCQEHKTWFEVNCSCSGNQSSRKRLPCLVTWD